MDLMLTDECVAPEACLGCDSLWAFWIGAGDDIINRFMFADSTRKSAGTGEGVVKSYARGRYYRKAVGGNIFSANTVGEDMFFAIVDADRKQQFLNSPIIPEEWQGDGRYTFSSLEYVTSQQSVLYYTPERPMALCVCNNNSVSTIPVFFRFQQFLTEPVPVDSSKLLESAYGPDPGDFDPAYLETEEESNQ
jgi:hypothetical protein